MARSSGAGFMQAAGCQSALNSAGAGASVRVAGFQISNCCTAGAACEPIAKRDSRSPISRLTSL